MFSIEKSINMQNIFSIYLWNITNILVSTCTNSQTKHFIQVMWSVLMFTKLSRLKLVPQPHPPKRMANQIAVSNSRKFWNMKIILERYITVRFRLDWSNEGGVKWEILKLYHEDLICNFLGYFFGVIFQLYHGDQF